LAKIARTKRVMTQLETVRMSQILLAHCFPVEVAEGAEPLCRYEDGWDDERVARETAEGLTINHSGLLRRNLLGNFVEKADTADKRIAFLEKKLGDALILLAELTSKHDKLCMGITLARVGLDCKHLIIDPEAIKLGVALQAAKKEGT
jgi:hypothetical protein